YWMRSANEEPADPPSTASPIDWSFLTAREALMASGVPVMETGLALSTEDAVAWLDRWGPTVAVKAEAPGLLHKSDIGDVRLNCASDRDVREAYVAVLSNAHEAGFTRGASVLVQPMVNGLAEAYAGIIDDPAFGPAICFGLGGVFVEIMH